MKSHPSKADPLPLVVIVDLIDTYVFVENLTNKKDQDGLGSVACLGDGSDSEVEPLSIKDDE